MSDKIHSIFSVFGIEIEYMIVHTETLDIMPIADWLIERLSGTITNEIELGEFSLSNELALHVVEIKTNGPKPRLAALNNHHTKLIHDINTQLQLWNAMLLPTAMHPWFVPTDDVKLWPHGDREIYQAYHSIFGCRGHGWTNLQSMHLNLPFDGEAEFVDLHNSIRHILPLIPALTASSPLCEGNPSGVNDTRLLYYGNNQVSIPSISGNIIPESISSIKQYRQEILERMYEDIHSHDNSKILQYEWLNSRGAIARFDRNAIEIRVIDSQECINADLACASLISALIKHVVQNTDKYKSFIISDEILRTQYDSSIREGFSSPIVSDIILNQLGLEQSNAKTIGELWKNVFERLSSDIDRIYHSSIQHILNHGNLAERILKACHHSNDRSIQKNAYQKLALCLNENRMFLP